MNATKFVDRRSPFDLNATQELLAFMAREESKEEKGHSVRSHFNMEESDESCFQEADMD